MRKIQEFRSNLVGMLEAARTRLREAGRPRAGLPLRIALTALVAVLVGVATRRLPRR